MLDGIEQNLMAITCLIQQICRMLLNQGNVAYVCLGPNDMMIGAWNPGKKGVGTGQITGETGIIHP